MQQSPSRSHLQSPRLYILYVSEVVVVTVSGVAVGCSGVVQRWGCSGVVGVVIVQMVQWGWGGGT